MLTGKPQLSRVVNRQLVLERIRKNGAVSRAELAELTRIRPPTVGAVVNQLLDEGLVEEIGAGKTRGGRAPRMVALRRGVAQALGFEITETAILAGVCDLSGSLLAQIREPFSPAMPERTLDRVDDIRKQILTQMGIEQSEMLGVGVALPGDVHGAEGIVRWSKPFDWHDVHFREMCEARWQTTTDVVNDSLAGGMAASFLGGARGIKSLVFLNLRFMDASHGVVGIGAGIIVNGEPYHGEFGAAGEITVPIVHPAVRAQGSGPEGGLDVAGFIGDVESQDPKAVAALNRTISDLSTLVVHTINLLEPGLLVIGSDVAAFQAMIMERLGKILEQHKLSCSPGTTRLVPSTLGEYGIVCGAVVPTLQRVFRLPRWS